MKSLQITKTVSTLGVDFDAENGTLELSGSSYPENSERFFSPILEWIEGYISKVGKPILLNFKLDYLNTSSTKCILDIVEILERYHNENGKVEINWYYVAEDEDLLETGQEILGDTEWAANLIPYFVS
jgi:hypothetical protein